MKPYHSLLAVLLIALLAVNADADVTPVPSGYEVSYQIDLSVGTSNGLDILDTFIFEWNENGDFSVDYPYTINNRGRTLINHTIGFKPTAALLMGYGLGVPGIGDEKDHMFTVISSEFANSVIGQKWSQAFPGVPPDPRIGHNAMINLLKNAAVGGESALKQLTDFVKKEGYKAGFDPIGSFRVLEWTIVWPIDYIELIAGGGSPKSAMDVGNVTFGDDGTDLTITYNIDTGDCEFVETNLHVATEPADFPQSKKGNPKVGRFDYSDPPEDPFTSQTYTIPLEDILGSSPDSGENTLYIAAHAVIECPDGEDTYRETAWGEGTEFNPGKKRSWAMYFTHTVTIPEPTGSSFEQ